MDRKQGQTGAGHGRDLNRDRPVYPPPKQEYNLEDVIRAIERRGQGTSGGPGSTSGGRGQGGSSQEGGRGVGGPH